jgi:hypothetical protein
VELYEAENLYTIWFSKRPFMSNQSEQSQDSGQTQQRLLSERWLICAYREYESNYK